MTVILQIIWNVYLRHRGIPGKFWWMATDITYARRVLVGDFRFSVEGFREIQKMHSEMGIDMNCNI